MISEFSKEHSVPERLQMDRFTDAMIKQNRLWLFPYVQALVGDTHLTEDIVQETFRRALHSIAQYDGQKSVGAWLRGIAKNVILETKRKQIRYPLSFPPEVIDQLDSLASQYETMVISPDLWSLRKEAMKNCIQRLHERMQKLIHLRYYRKLRSIEIGHQLGMTPSAVDMALSRVRKWLYHCIDQYLQQNQ